MTKFVSEHSKGTEFGCLLEGAQRGIDSVIKVDTVEPVLNIVSQKNHWKKHDDLRVRSCTEDGNRHCIGTLFTFFRQLYINTKLYIYKA